MPVDFNNPAPVGRELEYVTQAIQSGHISGDGAFTKKCHAFLQEGLGVPRVLLTTSCTHALDMSAILLNIKPGDEVIIPTPCFVAYQAEVIMAGGVPVEIPTRMEDNFQVDPARIREAITLHTKAIFVGYPSNPTGAVATREVLTEIAQIAEENDLILISDEIYDRLVYDGFQHVCVPALGEAIQQRTVLLGGFSKDYAMTGWRIGYAAGPVDIIRGMTRIHQYSIMSAPTTAQAAALFALEHADVFAAQAQELRAQRAMRWRSTIWGSNTPPAMASRMTISKPISG